MEPKSPSIGPYRLGDRLGHGGMGEVYQAYDRRLDREVAIKFIRQDGAGRIATRPGQTDPGRIQRFRREARLAAGLDHPAIVQVHDILESADGDAIVMELVRGTDLGRRRRDGGLTPAQAVDVLRQVAAGLAVAHAGGLVHRDLKAENVMLRPDGRVKILDFGVAILEREPQEQGPVGTYRAMSPEQARGLAVDARSDLFSFGVLAYELLADRSPFVAEAPRETLRNVCVLRQAPLDEIVPDLPVDLARLVDRLLEKNPARRPAGAADVEARLEAIADGLGDGPESTPPPVALELPGSTGGLDIDGTTRLSHAPGIDRPGGVFMKRGALLAFGLVVFGIAAIAILWPGDSELGDAGQPLDASLEARAEVRPLYVAVAEPRIEGRAGLESSDLMAATVRVALQRSLVSLVGAAPINAEALDALDGTPLERARSLGVDELVMSTVDCVPDACHVAVSRVRTADGSVVWTRGLPVPSDDLWLLARAVENHLSQAFPGLERREGFPELKVAGEDYAEYHRLRRASRERRLPPAELLEGVGELLRRSPDFLEAILFEAFILRERFLTERDPNDIDLAVERLAAARRLFP